MNRTTSDTLFDRARQVMPGGVSSPVRAFRSVGGTPVFFESASGARFTDADGHEYVDFCLSWGPLILGHAHPAVLEAVAETAAKGLSFGACSHLEIELAERILAGFPSYDQVRFVSSGTEAVMTAIRLARGATGRPAILKFEGGYHGHSDSLLVKAGSGLATFGISSSAGVPAALAAHTLVLPFDDEAALVEAFARHGANLAAAIVEPLPGNNGLLEQRPAWLRRLRELCDAHGSLLIFDEVISGFRTCYGGYGESVGVLPDLVTLGKIVGGGMPVGALTGPRGLMEQLSPTGGVYQAGTLSGNPVAMAAGAATLDLLADGTAYARLEALGAALDRALSAVRAPLSWRRVGSLAWLVPGGGPVPRAAADIEPESIAAYNRIYRPLLDKGLYLAPSGYEVLFLSTAHTEADVARLGQALDELL